MGRELVKLASAHLGDLDGRPFKVAVCMALYALDTTNEKGQPANLYFGGWEVLAQAIGFTVPPEPPPDHPDRDRIIRHRRKLATQVSEAIRVLKGKSYLTPLEGKARVGSRQTYQLHPAVWRANALRKMPATSVPLQGDAPVPPQGVRGVPPQGVESHPLAGGPRRDLGKTDGISQESIDIVSEARTGRVRVVFDEWMNDAIGETG